VSAARPALLFYCQHSVGLGHLVRSLALAEALAERFDVTLLSGGARAEDIRPPRGVELVALPALGMTGDGALVSRDAGLSVDDAFALRRRMLTDALHATRPAVLLVEMFPFGRKKFAPELVPLLDAAMAAGPDRPLVACSLRDILVSRGARQEAYDERACRIANRYFDAILVHADPRLARLEDSFHSSPPLRVAVHYTGFVVPSGAPAPVARRGGIVVSAGGGIVGGPLVRAAVAAHRARGAAEPMRIVAGPFLPEDEWRALEREAAVTDGLEAVRSVPSLRDELAGAALSISQCGYNTALDLLRTRVPALVVPYAPVGEDEQTRRARTFEALGAVRVLDPARLDGDTLAAAIDATLPFRPRALDIGLDGAADSARLLERLAGDAEAAA
jgi:predicted glycosyltransferase